MPGPNPEDWTVEELNAAIDRLDLERIAVANKARFLAEIRGRKLADLEMEAKLGGLTPEQRQRVVVKPGVADAAGTVSPPRK